MLRQICDSLLTVFYPQDCEVCGNCVEECANGIACKKCWENTRIFADREILCFKCGRFLSESQSRVESNCHQCTDHFYENARASGIYETALAASILQLKKEPHICSRLKKLFIESSKDPLFRETTLIVPIPLSRNRMIERGFNQARFLAEIVSKHHSIRVDSASLIRTKHAKIHRAGMDRKARLLSVKKSFEVKRRKMIEGEKILLIDDVLTSGATVSSCAQVLKAAGAPKVYVLTLARAV